MRIAVVGSGIAGLSAAWLLHKNHAVTVYEKNNWVGGHSNTVDAIVGSRPVAVDTGFIVYNDVNYPNLVALFDYLDVPRKMSEMSFSASLCEGKFEYSGTDLNGLFGQRRNIIRARFWCMLWNIIQFYNKAPKFLANSNEKDLSLGSYLKREGYDRRFIEDHLLPMGAAIWSTTAAEIEAYPAQAFIRFFQSHGLLSLKNRPTWRTVDGGSREYVSRLTESFRDSIHFTAVATVTRSHDKILIHDYSGDTSSYDHVIFAGHADETLSLLADATNDEKRLLGAWRYTKNRAVLHSDPSLMPKRRRVWSSWNFLNNPTTSSLCVTYWMNRLQSLQTDPQLFVTLNPIREPKVGTMHREFCYTHPYFDKSALQSQRELWTLQGVRRSWFCGSYFGYGFHEDALQSGLAVAEQLGGLRRPWSVPNENGRITTLLAKDKIAA